MVEWILFNYIGGHLSGARTTIGRQQIKHSQQCRNIYNKYYINKNVSVSISSSLAPTIMELLETAHIVLLIIAHDTHTYTYMCIIYVIWYDMKRCMGLGSGHMFAETRVCSLARPLAPTRTRTHRHSGSFQYWILIKQHPLVRREKWNEHQTN